ncbi:putative phosphodiesterase [Rhodopseudomonas rhenobacensis]|uniref:Putative phosphodiesterase n=1 Tax=Rhodopseudomonas rhenobacensis TaxID=87461 RepID=A0A7W7Z308_9BRAD|nr:metallophosphoesterase [Rhodopseudomonas rhenobacensis]MBB5046860.1 putative phosphodiesterase [Rhodopseudomonas rhenobacensis]
MRILIASDLHIEHGGMTWTPPPDVEFDVAVFAGDVAGSPIEAVKWLAAQPALADKRIIFVAGNHEFYGGIIEDRIGAGKSAAAHADVHFLDADDAPLIEGVRFIGCTLWTDYRFQTKGRAGLDAGWRLNDPLRILTVADGRSIAQFSPQHAARRHIAERRWLTDKLAEHADEACVVVTHHGCHPGSLHPRYAGAGAVNASFISDMSAEIATYQPALWVHGHVHDTHDYTVGDTRVVCNPRGYPLAHGMSENAGFMPAFVVEIEQPRPRLSL